MKKIKVSIAYQVINFVLVIGCIHSGVFRIFIKREEMQMSLNFTLPLLLLVVVYAVNTFHFRKLKVEKLFWLPMIFTSSDEREQKIMDKVSSTGFRTILPLCLSIGFAFMGAHLIFQMFIGNTNIESIVHILLDILWASIALPYMIYTITVYTQIKKV